MDEVVAALGERVDDRRQARHADLQARVEGDVDLGDRAQPAVDVGVGADHLDLEAGHAAVADLLDRVGDAVHPAEAVGDQRDPRAVAVAAGQLQLLAPEERRRGGVRDRRDAGVEQPECGAVHVERLIRRGSAIRDHVIDDRRRARARGSGGRGGTGRGG